MNYLYAYSLTAVLLIGCDSNKSADALASKTDTNSTSDQSSAASGSHVAPDTSSWIRALENGIGYSYKAAPQVCVSFGPYRNRHIITTTAGKQKSAIAYTFRTISNNPDEIPAVSQLHLLEKKGLLESTKVEIDGNETLNYGLTVKGWALAPNASDGSLCFDAGRMAVKKILDYKIFPDQGSGLIAYDVSYEIGTDLREWIDNEVIAAFKYKVILPRIEKAILVKGPRGYFYPSNHRARSLTISSLPTPEEALEIIKRDGFIEWMCSYSKCSSNAIKDFIIYYVGVPKGNMVQFRYSYSNDSAATLMGHGYLNVDAQGKWGIQR